MGIILTEQQKKAVSLPFENKISVLIGGAGTGKTTVIKNILDNAVSKNKSFRLAAPTGKAAKRIIESTGRYASTIHSLLQPMFDGTTFSFGLNEDNPIDADIVIIDEISMIDTNLMYDLLKAIDPEKTSLLLVGDSGQLPSVGPGSILHNIVASSKIKIVELDIIHRNAGLIIEACSAVRHGKNYQKNKQIDIEALNPKNLVHIDAEAPDQILNAIVNITAERMPKRGFNSVWDVQIISPVNTKGLMSCESINNNIQKWVNPLSTRRLNSNKRFEIFPGDKVITTKNGKQKGLDPEGEQIVVNGDIGKVIGVEKAKYIVEFFDPKRVVEIKKTDNHLLLAYCITCHRFQGSEAPVVIIPVHKSFTFFSNRKWLYTALSRGKQLVITVGDFTAIRSMIANTRGDERITFLDDTIRQGYDNLVLNDLEDKYDGI